MASWNEGVEYYKLCARAAALGIPVSLDDPCSPRTVDDLRAAVVAAEQQDYQTLAMIYARAQAS